MVGRTNQADRHIICIPYHINLYIRIIWRKAVARWSRGMILALGAKGPELNSRTSSPLLSNIYISRNK